MTKCNKHADTTTSGIKNVSLLLIVLLFTFSSRSYVSLCTMSSILHTCILIILIVSVNGNWEKIGERILNKISRFSPPEIKEKPRKLFVCLVSCSNVFILISESGLEHSIKNGMKYKQGGHQVYC